VRVRTETRSRWSVSAWRGSGVSSLLLSLLPAVAVAQGGVTQSGSGVGVQVAQGQSPSGGAESDLQRGIALTRQGRFAEAIPLLLASKGKGEGGYAANFNLALCYVGSAMYGEAVTQLLALKESGSATAAVSNLLAQAYLGEHDVEKAWPAVEEAIRQAPTDERMYAFLLDACTDHYQYGLGLQTATLGMRSLPGSARLHYERAVFLARLDRLEEAKPEFAKAAALDSEGDIGYLASVQALLYEDDLPHALETARRAVKSGHRDFQMLSLLGTVLMYMGATPEQPQFSEARDALETSVRERSDYSTSQIGLGKLYLMEGRTTDAVTHLEIGRRLEPRNVAVYRSLAAAYRQLGNREASAECTRILAGLLRETTVSVAPGKLQDSTRHR